MINANAKSIFCSMTLWGAIGALITSITPIIGKVAIDREPFTSKDLELVVGAVVACTITIVGRATASGPVYTPHGIPGYNKEDLIEPRGHLLGTTEDTDSDG